MRPPRANGAGALLLIWTALVGAHVPAAADVVALQSPSPPAAETRDQDRPRERADPALIERVQRALKEAGLYDGPLSGRMSGKTRAALRAYQRENRLKPDGRPTRELLRRIETGLGVAALLGRIERARKARIDAALRALMSRPETRGLVLGAKDEVADPSRDSGPCFRRPTARCLLAEAGMSAKAVFKREMRDWALGEILVAQAKAGLSADAMETVRRIADPRLIMVALRDIARIQALEGRGDDALAAAEIIPDPLERAEALARIAAALAARNEAAAAATAVRRLLATLQRVTDRVARTAFLARAAVILSEAGFSSQAEETIEEAEGLARSLAAPGDAARALHHVAAALAKLGRPAAALAILKEVSEPYRTAVLVSAAAAQAQGGDVLAALDTAEAIGLERYRAVVLSEIATAQSENGDGVEARETLDLALAAAGDIKLAYAHAYALSRITAALVEIAVTWDPDAFDRAVSLAKRIEVDTLRARILWLIAAEQRRTGNATPAAETEALAAEATEAVRSRLNQVWLYSDVAADHAEASEPAAAWKAFRKAKNVAAAIDNPWARARALAKLAGTLVDLAEATN